MSPDLWPCWAQNGEEVGKPSWQNGGLEKTPGTVLLTHGSGGQLRPELAAGSPLWGSLGVTEPWVVTGDLRPWHSSSPETPRPPCHRSISHTCLDHSPSLCSLIYPHSRAHSLEGRNQQHGWSVINMEAGAVAIHASEISNQGSHPEDRELGLEARPPALL